MYSPFLQNNQNNKTTLWMGELEPWMDETYIRRLWFNLNANVVVKVIRDKATFASSGYAFVDFGSISAAQYALDKFNGETIPNTTHTFKLNWASGGGLVDRKEDRQPEYSIFLGDLVSECTEQMLLTIFQSRYLSCKSAKIMTDPRTGQSRGYGFVRFLHQLDQIQAMNEMQGFVIGNRPIRVSLATPKHHTNQQLNTTVFVGGLSCPISEDELKQYFHIFGDIVYVKIPPGKGCGFVQYVSRYAAELAIEQMNGYQIGSSRIRLSWGKSQQQADKKQSFTSPSSSLVSPSFIHPFDEDQGFMTVFSSNNYINLDPVTAATSAASPTATTQSVTSSGHHASSWPTDCHHIFAQ